MEGKKIERKYLAHYIDANFKSGTAKYVRLGKDLEEYNINLNPDVESKKNILGESSVNHKGYEPSADVDTYYCYEGDELFEHLMGIVNERSTGSDCETTAVDVLISSDGTVDWAYRENVVIGVNSVGGDTSGMQIPFTVNYNGGRLEGDFNIETKTFTEL